MHVLIVEDEPKMAHLLQKMLLREGFTVTLAADGLVGLSLGCDPSFGMIILDRMLPSMEGSEVARQLRASGVATPILMLTAQDGVAHVVSGLDSGVDDYITKPFAFDELFARMRSLVRRRGVRPDAMLVFGDLSLDPRTYEVWRNGQFIRLTRTEFQILEMLIREPGKVVPREELINGVWGRGLRVDDNTIDSFIKQLRAKVDSSRTPKIIQTVRGVGYRLARELV